MRYLPTGKQMQYADKNTIETIGIPSMVLMERAAIGIFYEVVQRINYDDKILVVCGPGNNGGDGYAVARLLYLKGYHVHLLFVGSEGSRSKENIKQKQICDYYHIPTVHSNDLSEYSVIIDGIFGTGLSRQVTGTFYTMICAINSSNAKIFSIDIPSGLNDRNGQVMGVAVHANWTVSLAFDKRGLYFGEGIECSGEIITTDIGITDRELPQDEYLTYTLDFADCKKLYPKRLQDSHKGTYGRILLIVGGEEMSGAAYLSAHAAYVSGCGLVHVYTHENNKEILSNLLPEAIITTYKDFCEEKLISLIQEASVIGIGCGMGMTRLSEKILEYTLRYSSCPCVIDADGINILANHMEWLMYAKSKIVLTPHMKEMSRLTNLTIPQIKEERFKIAVEFAEKNAVTCILKDARTIVTKRDKDIYVNLTGNNAMAKAGSGDVLTGILCGIIAQGLDIYEAACLATFLHGAAGNVARSKNGQYSVLARDLIDGMKEILQQL